MNKNKKMLIISAIVATILITLGVTYAFFRYSDSGVMQNSVQAGTIKFIYNESNREGNGISLEEALPMSDEVGKTQDTYFDFSVKGTTNTFELPYEITLRKTTSSDSIDNAVKMYLTEIVGGIETEKVLTMYNSLGYSSNELALINHEKSLLKSEIPKNQTDYVKNYRLRMWLNDDPSAGDVLNATQTITAVCSDSTYTTKEDCIAANKDWVKSATSTGKTFAVKVNVYAQGEPVLAAGLYDENNNMIYSWQELIDNKFIAAGNYLGQGTNKDGLKALEGKLIVADRVSSVSSSALKDCTGITSVKLPAGVTVIDNNAFQNCTSLTSINIPDSVTTIGNYAFKGCTNLKEINIPNGITKIGTEVFHSCKNLKNVTIPKTVTSIEGGAFAYSGIENISIPNSVTTIGQNAFNSCKSLQTAKLSKNITDLPYSVFANCSVLESLVIPNGVTNIAPSAFENTGFKSVTIPNTVTSIGNFAFKGTGLLSVNIPNSVTTIGTSAFASCTNLKNATISNTLETISTSMFESCSSLESIIIPDSVTTINNQAFYRCSNLANVTIGKNVTSISQYAFAQCTSLNNVVIPEKVTFLGSSLFFNDSSLTSVTFENPNGWEVGGSIELSSTDLSDPAISANYLLNNYRPFEWSRSN